VNAAQQHAVYAQQAQQHSLAHSQQTHLQQAPPGQRRPSIHGAQNHQASLGALAPVGRVPNKNGLSFDLILTRLQNEVQRSRETSADLQSLTVAMSDIHDSLGGVSVSALTCMLKHPLNFRIFYRHNLYQHILISCRQSVTTRTPTPNHCHRRKKSAPSRTKYNTPNPYCQHMMKNFTVWRA
jgi:hypothetical protein